MLQSMKEVRWRRIGVVAIDGTLLPKTGRKIPGAVSFGTTTPSLVQRLVTSYYVDLDKDYPSRL